MTTLAQALEATSWHFLITIGRQRQIKLDSNLHKTDLINILSHTLIHPDNIRPALATLSEPAQQLLVELQLAGGRLARRHLAESYGRLRPPREIIQILRQQSSILQAASSPAQATISPVEEVSLLGLVYLDQTTDDLFIPTELLPLLPARPPQPQPRLPAVAFQASPAELAAHDLAYLLALLQREEIWPRHGRWLTPKLLLAWGRGCRVRPVSPQARGEIQTGRRRFLHYLAENAGWLTSWESAPKPLRRTLLKPTPAAWLWLNGSPQERLKALWQSWSSPDPERWRAFRLPGATWMSQPEALLTIIHSYLPRLDPANPAQFARLLLARQPDLLDLVPANLLEPAAMLTETIVQILIGPLVWLGALGETDRDSEREGDGAGYRLTAEGQAWLVGESLPAGPASGYGKFSIFVDLQADPLDSILTLTLPGGLLEPIDLVTALGVAEKESEEDNESEEKEEYRVTSSSFIKALHGDWSPPALLDALNRLADRPLTGQETALLHTWAEAAGKMTIHNVALLETTEPEIINRLASTRRGRELIHRTLSARAVIVDPARLEQLVRRLNEQEGIPPKVIRSKEYETGGQTASPTPYSPLPIDYLWLGLRIYQELGQLIRLPVHIPQSTIDELTAAITPTGLAAAAVAAEQVLASLQQLIEGQAPFPSWSGGLPVDDSLPIIETALASGQVLELHYRAASTDTVTRRQVEPYRLEWHGDVPYLVGFCHRAQAERMFRLDRIERIGEADRDSEREGETDEWTGLL